MDKKTISGNALQIAWTKKTSAEASCKSQEQKKHQRKRPANRMGKKNISGTALQIAWAFPQSAKSFSRLLDDIAQDIFLYAVRVRGFVIENRFNIYGFRD